MLSLSLSLGACAKDEGLNEVTAADSQITTQKAGDGVIMTNNNGKKAIVLPYGEQNLLGIGMSLYEQGYDINLRPPLQSHASFSQALDLVFWPDKYQTVVAGGHAAIAYLANREKKSEADKLFILDTPIQGLDSPPRMSDEDHSEWLFQQFQLRKYRPSPELFLALDPQNRQYSTIVSAWQNFAERHSIQIQLITCKLSQYPNMPFTMRPDLASTIARTSAGQEKTPCVLEGLVSD